MAKTQLEVQLAEELKRWQLAGMRAAGVPAGFEVPGIPVELYEIEVRTSAVIKLMMDKGIFTKEEADIYYQQEMLERLTKIREANEENIKKQRMANEIAVAQKRLLGPNGQPFN